MKYYFSSKGTRIYLVHMILCIVWGFHGGGGGCPTILA